MDSDNGSKGKLISSGLMVMYALKAGIAYIYSEGVTEEGDCFVFDADRSAIMSAAGQTPQGVTWIFEKMSKQTGFPAKVRYHKNAIAYVSDCRDKGLRSKAMEAITGLSLV